MNETIEVLKKKLYSLQQNKMYADENVHRIKKELDEAEDRVFYLRKELEEAERTLYAKSKAVNAIGVTIETLREVNSDG